MSRPVDGQFLRQSRLSGGDVGGYGGGGGGLPGGLLSLTRLKPS